MQESNMHYKSEPNMRERRGVHTQAEPFTTVGRLQQDYVLTAKLREAFADGCPLAIALKNVLTAPVYEVDDRPGHFISVSDPNQESTQKQLRKNVAEMYRSSQVPETIFGMPTKDLSLDGVVHLSLMDMLEQSFRAIDGKHIIWLYPLNEAEVDEILKRELATFGNH
jgi:hypothetical protein